MVRAFPHYQQLDDMDCGSTALRMIAKYYGKEYSAETLRKYCHGTRDGISMLGISEAAEMIGFRTLGVRITLAQLANDAHLPCILHWNQNHFVVCYKVKKNRNGSYRIYIADPASQCLCFTEKEFLHCWLSSEVEGVGCGMALLLVPTTSFKQYEDEGEKAQRHKLGFFFHYLMPYKKQIVQLMLGMVLGSLLQLIVPFLTQAMVDQGIQQRNLSMITLILIAQLIIFITQLSVEYIRNWILLHMNSRVDISLISDFLIKLMNMPLNFFETKKIGDIMQRINDHGRIKTFLTNNSISMVFSAVNFIIFSSILAYFSTTILCVFLIGNSLYVLWVCFFMKYRRELDYKRFIQASNDRNKIIQLLEGIQDIKLNNCEKQKRWEWENIQAKLFNISVKGLTIGQIQQSGSLFFSQTTNILVSFIAASYVVEGYMTLGMMMSLTYVIGQINAPIHDFIGFMQIFQDAKISLERLNEIHLQRDENTDIQDKVNEIPNDKNIYLENVTFSYDGAERNYALNDISLTIPAGKVTAIVGESGSGKTTLMKLLQGFYQPNHGDIRIGKCDLNRLNPHLWRSVTGSVMQDSFIFSDTIARNIAIGDTDIDKERLLQSTLMANADEFIRNLPLSYNTRVGMEGNGISQGQRQRLLIARAIYKNPQFIFFDEATNALDTSNEKEIIQNLETFYKGKTVVIAAHRLSTVKNADQIIVLKHGKIVERGAHAELVKNRQYYYELIRNQLDLNS